MSNVIIDSSNMLKTLAFTNVLNNNKLYCNDVQNVSMEAFDKKDDLKKYVDERIDLLKTHCIENNINYSYLVSSEIGCEKIADEKYLVCYTKILTSDGEEFFDKRLNFTISQKLFDYIKSGSLLKSIDDENLTSTDKHDIKKIYEISMDKALAKMLGKNDELEGLQLIKNID